MWHDDFAMPHFSCAGCSEILATFFVVPLFGHEHDPLAVAEAPKTLGIVRRRILERLPEEQWLRRTLNRADLV